MKSSLDKKTFFSLSFVKFTGVVVGTVLNVGLARLLGPSMLGTYQYYMSVVSFFTVVTLFGSEDTIFSKI